jgi:hypothetical protein
MNGDKFDETFTEQIDYKSLIVKQIEFIHEGFQLGEIRAINNGILSLETLLFPKLDDETSKEIENLTANVQKEINEMRPALYGRQKGEYEEKLADLNYKLQVEKYRVLLEFCEKKDLLATEIDTEEL